MRRVNWAYLGIGAVSGAALGALLPGVGASLGVAGNLYRNLVDLLVVPAVFSSPLVVIAGPASELSRLQATRKLAWPGILLVLLATTLAVLTEVSSTGPLALTTARWLVEHFVPESALRAAAQSEVPQVLFWSTLFACALAQAQRRTRSAGAQFVAGLAAIVEHLIGIAVALAPFGFGAQVAVRVSRSTVEYNADLQLLQMSVAFGLLLVCRRLCRGEEPIAIKA